MKCEKNNYLSSLATLIPHCIVGMFYATDVLLVLGQATLGDLNINTVKPKTPKLSVYSKRWESYLKYSRDNPVSAKDLCEAGFFYEGEGDKVKCFWCDGALEMWSRGDDPWAEHAK